MKTIKLSLMALALVLTTLSCSTDDESSLPVKSENQSIVPPPPGLDPKLDAMVEDCILKQLEQQGIKTNSKSIVPPPPGFDVCDCIEQAIDSTYKK